MKAFVNEQYHELYYSKLTALINMIQLIFT